MVLTVNLVYLPTLLIYTTVYFSLFHLPSLHLSPSLLFHAFSPIPNLQQVDLTASSEVIPFLSLDLVASLTFPILISWGWWFLMKVQRDELAVLSLLQWVVVLQAVWVASPFGFHPHLILVVWAKKNMNWNLTSTLYKKVVLWLKWNKSGLCCYISGL